MQRKTYLKKWCVLTPLDNKNRSHLIIRKIWEEIGMNVSIMNVEEHDKIMSITSHLPHLIAFTIVGTAFSIDLKKERPY